MCRVLRSFLLILLSRVYGYTSIRGYSVVWRNAQNQVVKRAVYNRDAVFTSCFPTELDELNRLPTGYVYELHVLNSDRIDKIVYTRRLLDR